MTDQPEPTTTTLYDGKYVRLVKQGPWEFARRKGVSGIVGIVAVTDDRRLVLVEQFRPPVGRLVIELPAGLAGDVAGQETEELADAARRELLEETGYEAAGMTYLAAGAASAGLSDEVITLFRATGLRKTGEGTGDGSEQITLHKVPLAHVARWLDAKAKAGCLIDLKVYSGLYFVTTAGDEWAKHE
jgi:ADP-ribose pyrophosphatase